MLIFKNVIFVQYFIAYFPAHNITKAKVFNFNRNSRKKYFQQTKTENYLYPEKFKGILD